MDLHYMDQRLRSLVIFRELLMDPVIAGFEAVLAMADEDDGDAFATVCAEFESSLLKAPKAGQIICAMPCCKVKMCVCAARRMAS